MLDDRACHACPCRRLRAARVGTGAAAAKQQSVEDFYAAKDVTLYIGTAPGGAYDLFGRLVARHMGRHLPGRPAIVPVNMEGAGSLKIANWFHSGAPRDGSVIATINRGTSYEPLIGNAGPANFDPPS